MKKMMILFLILIAAIFTTAAANAGDRIAYINLPLIIAESDMGKQAREEFNKTKASMEGEIKEKIKELEALNTELQKERKKDPVDEKKIAGVIEKLQQKNKEYERLAADLKEELAKKDRELVRQILEKVAPILTELAASKGYAVIFKSAADLAYVAPDADITKEVIDRLNKIKPEKGKRK
ncbi:MAG: OmpH family outer membrane protein [Nitrospirae bacterium]|nr:MAG: OmpH family outer membrane protein [Nitrospirota bacterium]